MNPASKTSTDRSIEQKLELQAARLVTDFKSRIKQLLADEGKKRTREVSIANVKDVTWTYLYDFLTEKFKEATNLVAVVEKTEKALDELIGTQADLVRFTEPEPSK